MADLLDMLHSFNKKCRFSRKGPLCVALVVTQHARIGLPLDPDALLTEDGRQVLGLGPGAVQTVLNDHGVSRIFATEGELTSRDSIANMRKYVAFLNSLAATSEIDLDTVEGFWVDRAHGLLLAKPFEIRLDASRSLRAMVRDLLYQAEERQRNTPGLEYAGPVLKHLVGATLDCIRGTHSATHTSFSKFDAQSGRTGDFSIGDEAIHVTTAPSEAIIHRCRDNINNGYRPVIITTARGLIVAEALAENDDLDARIDIIEVEQFVAIRLYILGKFAQEAVQVAVRNVLTRYNEIVDEVETDPSLRIDFCQ